MDDERAILIGASVLLAGAILYTWLTRRASGQGGPGLVDGLALDAEIAYETIASAVMPGSWTPPTRAVPYLEAIYSAEASQGMPPNLLARLLYQESRFRPEIIDGSVRSSAGAIGIAQFMPATAAEYRINPADPFQAIPAAAQELRKLFNRFGTWDDALAAYNWGQGNWSAYQQTGLGAHGQPRPEENIDYVAEIASDVGIA